MQIVTVYEGEDACQQCLGWKRVANSDNQESWKYWAELPSQSAIAIQMGLVKPVECPRCHGTGVEPSSGLIGAI
jgi:DnaJ-class molecular chaperone